MLKAHPECTKARKLALRSTCVCEAEKDNFFPDAFMSANSEIHANLNISGDLWTLVSSIT
jgi:hypothetical protein